MAIIVRCQFCKSDQSYKAKTCKTCGKKIPIKRRDYRVVLKRPDGTWLKKSVGSSLDYARNIEAQIKTELIHGTYFDRKKKIPTLHELWQKYLP